MGWGVYYRGFFPGGVRLVSLLNNSFSVEQVISNVTFTNVLKQVLLSALIIFFLWSAKCFFDSLCDSYL